MPSSPIGVGVTDKCDLGCGRGERVAVAGSADELAPLDSPTTATSKMATSRAALINRMACVRFMFVLP
jgi:hypothetical protein